ncbi:unnamed protein product, partial [Polarella glacialis]
MTVAWEQQQQEQQQQQQQHQQQQQPQQQYGPRMEPWTAWALNGADTGQLLHSSCNSLSSSMLKSHKDGTCQPGVCAACDAWTSEQHRYYQ